MLTSSLNPLSTLHTWNPLLPSVIPYYVQYFPPSYMRTLTFWNFSPLYSTLLRFPGYCRLHFSHLQARPYVHNPQDLVRNQLSCISNFKQTHLPSSVSLFSCRALSVWSSRPSEKMGEQHFNTSIYIMTAMYWTPREGSRHILWLLNCGSLVSPNTVWPLLYLQHLNLRIFKNQGQDMTYTIVDIRSLSLGTGPPMMTVINQPVWLKRLSHIHEETW